MNEQDTEARAKVWVSFKRATTKDGGEGFDISVAEDCDEQEAARVMALAKGLRQQALDALAGKTVAGQGFPETLSVKDVEPNE